jgi:hypothetical protein
MRQRFTDWYRRNIHDNRPGRSDRRTVSINTLDDHHTPDFTDLVASNDRVNQWATAAQAVGFDVTDWIVNTLDDRADEILNPQRAA